MKAIPEFEGYMATEDGGIWSNYKGRFLKPWLSKAGYQRVTIRKKTFFVHRLVAMAYLENPDNKPHINHKSPSFWERG